MQASKTVKGPAYSGTIYIPIGPDKWTEAEARLEFGDVTVVADVLVCRVDGNMRNPIHDYWFPKGTVFDLYFKGVV